ncbi:MAG: hypothetical protein HY282_17110 [Nitrospirae bacterium]|nr:hypothetical protein [Candidatus Manganitrophaceae bacterium]
MTELRSKIQNALDEGRILILGAQVLIGFQFRSVFEKGFGSLSPFSQYLLVAALGLMLIALSLLISPAAYHRIVERGNDTEGLHRFTIDIMKFALMPFSLALGIDLYVAAEKLTGRPMAFILGGVSILVSSYFWYLMELIDRRERDRLNQETPLPRIGEPMKKNKEESTSEKALDQKIKHVLTEARVVLPGAQALLGFQFAIFFTEGFDALPHSSKYLHLISLTLVALATIFLITPAAYHRIVEEGENSERFHRLASRFILMAMVPLASGITGDFFLVLRKVTGSIPLSTLLAAATLFFFYGLWFGFPLYRRSHPRENEGKPIFIAAK